MENNEPKVMVEQESVTKNDNIDRKEALKKAGKYAAFTALGMMVLLSPKQSQADSPAPLYPPW